MAKPKRTHAASLSTDISNGLAVPSRVYCAMIDLSATAALAQRLHSARWVLCGTNTTSISSSIKHLSISADGIDSAYISCFSLCMVRLLAFVVRSPFLKSSKLNLPTFICLDLLTIWYLMPSEIFHINRRSM